MRLDQIHTYTKNKLTSRNGEHASTGRRRRANGNIEPETLRDKPEVGEVLEVLDGLEDDRSLVDADDRARFSGLRVYNTLTEHTTSAPCTKHLDEHLVTFRASRRRREMYSGHVHLCLSLAAFSHYCMHRDVILGNGKGCPLVVHYWADLQSVHRFRCYDNTALRILAIDAHDSYRH